MKLLPGFPTEFANETPMSHHLDKHMVSQPEIMPQIARLFKPETPFTSLLAEKGLTNNGLYKGMNMSESGGYKVVGNRKIMWPVKGIESRKGTMQSDATCPQQSTYKGKYKSLVYIYSDTNWFSPYDVLELKDRRTLVHVSDDQLPELTSDGYYKYAVRLVSNNNEDYIDDNLLTEGSEFAFAYTSFYEMSETAYEKYTFDQFGKTYMTIQRMKWSISGTAEAMKTRARWIESNGEKMWTDYANIQMMNRWAKAREYQMLDGKGTVSEKDIITLKDMKNREIMMGDGLMNLGDGSLKFPYNTLTEEVLHNVMQNMQLRASNETGEIELAVIAGQNFLWKFNKLMTEQLNADTGSLVEGSGDNKGINNTWAFYKFAGVKFIPVLNKNFDNPARPYNPDPNTGKEVESNRAIFVSMGSTVTGENDIELVALKDRQFKKGTVSGINEGGDNMSNSVDASHTHILCETGIVNRNLEGVAELFTPTVN